MIFEGLHSNPPQCVIETDTADPIVGDTPIFISETHRAYGTGIMFEPVGLEFLYTDATSPQVLVNIDGLPAVCPNLNCDYAYVTATALITNQAYDTSTRLLTVTGTSLPTADLIVSFGGVKCSGSPAPTYTETQI